MPGRLIVKPISGLLPRARSGIVSTEYWKGESQEPNLYLLTFFGWQLTFFVAFLCRVFLARCFF